MQGGTLPGETLRPIWLQLYKGSASLFYCELAVPLTCTLDGVLQCAIKVLDRSVASRTIRVEDVISRVDINGSGENLTVAESARILGS